MEDIPQFGLPEFYKEIGIKNTDDNQAFSVFKSDEVGDALNSGNPFRNVNYAIGLFNSGEAEISIDFKSFKVRSKMILAASPGQVITSMSDVSDGYGIIFNRDFLTRQKSEQWLKSLPMFHRFNVEPLIPITNEAHSELLDDFEKVWLEFHSEKRMKYDALESLLILILVKYARLFESSQKVDISNQRQHILKLETLINEQFKEHRKVSYYAEQMCMTPQHLNRITNKVAGKSVSDLIHEVLIIELKRYLVYTDMSSEEIAHHFNFHDNSYFTKTFKKAVGETPKAFRGKQGNF
ncbi:helix-turn-helix domain-containing protein [Cytophaga sp. FL35]|uniref:helix-turn-helix domain-containing protein n=1 Tax=Cytophaga sp. FL35 TaxID=1904456 RepID=UPI00165344AE|nr:helix-turn-helix domain-containing protein [Cytophaga sp. FL35]MBC7000807.1 helix-turn-helix domain-containing protein [Cytophaga sp. FL35]